MRVSIVLHAHLPWVRHVAPGDEAERWFHDALWTSYLPLLEVCRAHPGLTLSISPTLAAMMADRLLQARFEAHLEALVVVNERQRGTQPAADHYTEALASARGRWLAARGDVLGAFVDLARRGAVELWTTAVTHAYLPGLTPIDGAGAQLALGRALFERLALPPAGMWLPECAIDVAVERALGPATTVVDEHALQRSRALNGHGARLLARHREASHRVWSRAEGYPRHPSYRERHRDLGHTGAAIAPFRPGDTTGLRYWRITGPGDDKAAYEAEAAARQADRDAEDFVRWLEAQAADRDALVTAYDAELFGHWWYEGPRFLAAVATRIADSRHLTLAPASAVAVTDRERPTSSSWGRGGDHRVWIGPATAPLWRHVHATHRAVRSVARLDVGGTRGQAIDQAIRELMLLEASDWPFAIEGTPAARYAAARFATHHRRAWRLAAIGSGAPPTRGEARYLETLDHRAEFLHPIGGAPLRAAMG